MYISIWVRVRLLVGLPVYVFVWDEWEVKCGNSGEMMWICELLGTTFRSFTHNHQCTCWMIYFSEKNYLKHSFSSIFQRASTTAHYQDRGPDRVLNIGKIIFARNTHTIEFNPRSQQCIMMITKKKRSDTCCQDHFFPCTSRVMCLENSLPNKWWRPCQRLRNTMACVQRPSENRWVLFANDFFFFSLAATNPLWCTSFIASHFSPTLSVIAHFEYVPSQNQMGWRKNKCHSQSFAICLPKARLCSKAESASMMSFTSHKRFNWLNGKSQQPRELRLISYAI